LRNLRIRFFLGGGIIDFDDTADPHQVVAFFKVYEADALGSAANDTNA
jgi:hypothetical protein